MEHLDTILSYKPSGSGHLLANRSAMTFPPYEGSKERIDYLAYLDHHTCHLFNTASIQNLTEKQVYRMGPEDNAKVALFNRVNMVEEAHQRASKFQHRAENWAVIAKLVIVIPVMGVMVGQGFRFLKLDLPLIGGPMTATRWGILCGLTLQLGAYRITDSRVRLPYPAIAAAISTFMVGGCFIGPRGLLTRGLVAYGLSAMALYAATWRARRYGTQGCQEGGVCRNEFERLWTDLGKDLNNELDKAIEGRRPNLEELKEIAQKLIDQKESNLKQNYYAQTEVYQRQVITAAQRIVDFDPNPDPKENEIEAICRGEGEKFRTLAQRRSLLKTGIEQIGTPTSHEEIERNSSAQRALIEVNKQIEARQTWETKVRREADALLTKIGDLWQQFGPRAMAEQPDQDKNGPITYANGVYKLYIALDEAFKKEENHEQLPLFQAFRDLSTLHADLDEACRNYEAFNPPKEEFNEALAIATLCQANQDEKWRYGKDAPVTLRWAGTSEKLADVKSGRLSAVHFVHWVNERARIEKDMKADKPDPYPPSRAAYCAYDIYRRV